MDSLRSRVLRFVAQVEVQVMGLPLTEAVVDALVPRVDPLKIEPILSYLARTGGSGEADIEQAFSILGPALNQNSWLVESRSPTTNVVPAAPACPAETLPLQVESKSEIVQEGFAFDGPKNKSLPEQLDNHVPLIIAAGLFRTLPNAVINNPFARPQLDPRKIYDVPDGMITGYAHMKMTGFVMDTSFDIRSYFCLVSILGRMTHSQYERAATTHAKTIEPKDFYKPLLDVLPEEEVDSYIKNHMSDERIVETFRRFRNIALTFYEFYEDANREGNNGHARKGGILITGLVDSIKLENDGLIHIKPSLELRNLYRATERLLPMNRSNLLVLQHSLGSLLSFWIAAQATGQFNKDTGWVKVGKRFSAKEILSGIHPLKPGVSYRTNQYQMLQAAFIELLELNVIEIEIHCRGQRVELNQSNANLCIISGVKTNILITRHRLSFKVPGKELGGHRKGDHALTHFKSITSDDVDSVSLEDIHSKVKVLLKGIKRPRGKAIDNRTADKTAYYIKHYAETMTFIAKLLLRVKDDQKLKTKASSSLRVIVRESRQTYYDTFKSILSPEVFEALDELFKDAWFGAQILTGNRLADLIKDLPKNSQIKNYDAWKITFKDQLELIFKIIKGDGGNDMLNAIRADILKSRLVLPLNATGQSQKVNAIFKAIPTKKTFFEK